jgi:phosphate/sulfate permease
MIVDGGGLQRKTVTNILMAWVFTPGIHPAVWRFVLDFAEADLIG